MSEENQQSSEHQSADPAAAEGLLGAADIVAAFTGLRHELTLQVRAGRELTSGLDQKLADAVGRPLGELADRLGRLEGMAGRQTRPDAANGDLRSLALALAEVDEGLERAAEAMAAQRSLIERINAGEESGSPSTSAAELGMAAAWDAAVAGASWPVRLIAGRLLGRMRAAVLAEAARVEAGACAQMAEAIADAGRGLELLLLRVRRQMAEAGVDRIEVVHQPFDPESMRAIDTVADASMPAGIVTEELRPGYRLHGAVLRAADVRVAR
jgi:hypothetical protein